MFYKSYRLDSFYGHTHGKYFTPLSLLKMIVYCLNQSFKLITVMVSDKLYAQNIKLSQAMNHTTKLK